MSLFKQYNRWFIPCDNQNYSEVVADSLIYIYIIYPSEVLIVGRCKIFRMDGINSFLQKYSNFM